MSEPVLYAEHGSTWWPVLWGPAFACLGAGVELLSGPVHTVQWLIVAVVLFGVSVLWVNARRKVYRVQLTPKTLTQGRESLEIGHVTKVSEVGAAVGAKPLGGGWTVPRKTDEVPLRLDDGSTVLAWARDGEALRDALARLVEDRPVE